MPSFSKRSKHTFLFTQPLLLAMGWLAMGWPEYDVECGISIGYIDERERRPPPAAIKFFDGR